MSPSPRDLQTIESHILELQRMHPSASGDFTGLLNDISLAAKIISQQVNRAGLAENILGATGSTNVQGEEVQLLDEFANNVFIKCIGTRGQVCIMGSEEMADPVLVDTREGSGSYVVVFDPLDGSSNIDVNVSVGTIFGIWRRRGRLDRINDADLLQPGSELVAAGYVIYGSSTMFVYTAGHGVHGFTMDPGIGEFLLSHENIRTPFSACMYSVNEAYEPRWSEEVQAIVRQLKNGRDGGDGKGMTARYIGSLVADFHRNLLKGGVFLYPPTQDRPGGKLRLMCEAAPMAFIVEAAGGYASDGTRSILEIEPDNLHARVPLYIGCRDDVLWMEKMLSGSNGSI
ncbi:MAG: class 1 fructose-bisphosphatase [bacterium]|nr:class 1 fructose-bisphosphatase [bacterium]